MAATVEDVIEGVKALGPEIRARAGEAEAARAFPRDLVDKLKAAGVFRALAPKSHGGLEAEFPPILEVVAEAARADGSAGWTVMIGAATPLLLAKMPRETFDRAYAEGPDVIQAGLAGAPVGRAERVEGGYRVTGRWPFSSGCQHADWIIGAAIVTEGGEPAPGPAPGAPVVRVVALPAAEWTIEDTWHVAGLKGTGSHHTRLDDVFVPDAQAFDLFTGPPCLEGPLYGGLGAWTPLLHAAFAVGVARGALDDLVAQAGGGRRQLFARTAMKDSPLFQYELGELDADLAAAEALLARTAEAGWAAAVKGELGPSAANDGFRAGVWITQACLKICSTAFNLGGGAALYDASPLQRRMRDLNAGAQHAVVQKQNYQGVGAVRLGVAQTVIMR